ncbi:MAG: GNAT family N-acetyltransferase [Thermoguttaceae bacterium]
MSADSINPGSFQFRYQVNPEDRDRVRTIVQSTGFFGPHEVDVAVELVQERLVKGPASGYHFVFAERDGRTVGYACYGPITVTHGSYDLFWIAVDQSCQGKGLGKTLLVEVERLVREEKGRRIYIETSNRPQYASTRNFYLRCGYALEALLKEFYAPGDDKAIYVKGL